MTDLIVVGGGITGLTAAFRMMQLRPEARVTLLEADTRLGGKIRTVRRDGFWVDLGPDVFLARRQDATALCRAVGLSEALRPVDSRALIQRSGTLYPLPAGWTGLVPGRIGPLLRSPLLPPGARLRAMLEPLVPPRRLSSDESLEAFVVRRFGRGVYRHLVEPLVGGLYGSDAPVSLQATLPHLHTLEQNGGILRAWQREPRRAGPAFMALEGGMDRWPAALATALQHTGRVTLHTGLGVERIERGASGYRVVAGRQVFEAPAVIVTVPAPVAARLLEPLDARFSRPLQTVPHGSVGIVAVGYRVQQIRQPLPGATGYLVPRHEGGPVQAVTLFSEKHPGSAPAGHVLFRVFIRSEAAAEAPERLLHDATHHLEQRFEAEGVPVFTQVHAWTAAMPRYTLGHPERLDALEAVCATHPGLLLAGASYRGAGLPACIANAEHAAQTAARHLDFLHAHVSTRRNPF